MSLDASERGKRLAIALDTTPNEYLVRIVQNDTDVWKAAAEQLRRMDAKQLSLAEGLLSWPRDQSL